MSLSDPTAFYAVSMRPLDGLGALELNPSVAFTMIDRMLGGSGRGVAVNRALTEIEQNVIDGVVKLILENLTETWRGIVDVQFRIRGRETRPQMLQVAAPNEVVLLMSFEIRIGDIRGVLNICYPGRQHRGGQRQLHPLLAADAARDDAGEQVALDENVGRVTVTLTAGIEATIGAGDFLRLQVGDIVGLGAAGRRSRSSCASTARRKFIGAPVRVGDPHAHPHRGTGSRVPDRTPPEAPHVAHSSRVRPGPRARFAGVLQSVVTPDAEALPLDGAVAPGWLVPCELTARSPAPGTSPSPATTPPASRRGSLMKDAAARRRDRRRRCRKSRRSRCRASALERAVHRR